MTENRAFYMVHGKGSNPADVRREPQPDIEGDLLSPELCADLSTPPPEPGDGPTFLLISLPGGWPPGGTVQSATLIIVRDEVPGQGIAVDTLPVNLDVKAGSLSRIKEWLECL